MSRRRVVWASMSCHMSTVATYAYPFKTYNHHGNILVAIHALLLWRLIRVLNTPPGAFMVF